MSDASDNLALAIVLSGAITVSTAGVLTTSLQSPDPTLAAAVFPPWWTRDQVVAAADRAGGLVDFGSVSFVVTVRDPTGQAQSRLRQAGALFSLPPGGLIVCTG